MSRTITATIRLTGQVNSTDFPSWIETHARKLGIEVAGTDTAQGEMVICVLGHEEMVHALALGCSLGPKSVLVEEMEITPDLEL